MKPFLEVSVSCLLPLLHVSAFDRERALTVSDRKSQISMLHSVQLCLSSFPFPSLILELRAKAKIGLSFLRSHSLSGFISG